MIRRILVSFALAALSVASAATHSVYFVQASIGKGQELQAGDYQLQVKDNSVVILVDGRQKAVVPAKVENGAEKFRRTKVLYNKDNGKFVVQEIQIGGTSTKVTFDTGVQSGGGE